MSTRKVFTLLLSGVLSACTSQHSRSIPMNISSSTLSEPPPVVRVDVPEEIDPQLRKGIEVLHKTGNAPVLTIDGFSHYPYRDGLQVHCRVFRVTDIVLGKGETIRDSLVADADRWKMKKSTSGEGSAERDHLLIGPAEKGIKTDLLIQTNFHSYVLEIVEGGPATTRVGFWFPNEVEKQITKRAAIAAKAKTSNGERIEDDRYRVSGNAPWVPQRVFNDGTRTYILFPQSVRVQKMPILFVTYQGKDELVNYSVQWPWVIIPQLFDQAALVIGVGTNQERVTITRGR